MRNAIFPFVTAMAMVLMGCSNDDSNSKCESCTSNAGTKFEICDNGNGTYDFSDGTETEQITEEELLGFTPKEAIELACALDE
nr:hypothetical protein [Allomuricauda sp.]